MLYFRNQNISMFVSSNGNACMDILHIYGALIINYLVCFLVDDDVFVPIYEIMQLIRNFWTLFEH